MTEQDAADRAVKKVFAILGVDIDQARIHRGVS